MGQQTTYYLGRVIKLGNLTANMVVDAVLAPETITWYGNSWSFFDARLQVTDGVDYLTAKLIKFNPDGEVIIADPATRQEIVQSEPNLRIAASHFIYIPSVSGIAFSKVYGHIEERHFCSRFCDLVDQANFQYLVECQIDFISDLQSFSEKLLSLDGITKISAVVHPPNPLFGPLWKELKEYIKNRRADKMLIREEASIDEPLNTQLPQHVKMILEQTPDSQYLIEAPLPIGDAAILMAADGYGSGSVKGTRHGEKVVIKTSETIKNFVEDEDVDVEEIFRKAHAVFLKIEADRHMQH